MFILKILSIFFAKKSGYNYFLPFFKDNDVILFLEGRVGGDTKGTSLVFKILCVSINYALY